MKMQALFRVTIAGVAAFLLFSTPLLAQTIAPGPGPATCVNPPADLVAWWPLDETAPPTAFDIAGMHHGNQIGYIGFVPGMVGGAYHFSHISFRVGMVEVSVNDPLIDVGTSDFTIDAWINLDEDLTFPILCQRCTAGNVGPFCAFPADCDTSPGQGDGVCTSEYTIAGKPRPIVSNQSAASGIEFYLHHQGGNPLLAQLAIRLRKDAFTVFDYTTVSSPIQVGQWQHVAVTVVRNSNPKVVNFYVNGASAGTFTLDPSLVGSLGTGSLDIGRGDFLGNFGTCCPTNSYLNGALDELEIFSRALLAPEIHALFQAGSAGKCKAPLDHLKCYDIKDDLKLKPHPVVDLDSPQFGLEPGCKVVKATKFCVPVRKTVLVEPSTGLEPISGQGLLDDRICYEIHCKKPFPADQLVQDQFGTRMVRNLEAFEMCTPARKVQRCGNGLREGTEECDGGAACRENCTLEPPPQSCPAPPPLP